MRRLAVLACTVLSACGGGVWVSLGSGDEDAPSVSLAVSSREAAPGQVLNLAAAVSDDGGVAGVSFYRLDGDRAVLIGRDRDRPYESAVAVPADGRGVLRLFADATDEFGNVGTSPVEVVTIR